MKFTLDTNFLINLILYVVIIGFGLFALYYEVKDLSSAKHLDGTAYEKGDDAETIKEKISQTGKYQNNIIHWRRAYLVAALSSLLLIVLIKNKAPNGIELASGFLLLYIIVYMAASIYRKNVVSGATDRIDELLSKL